jgi:hypothetical protein
MESLVSRIDTLIAVECVPWHRDGYTVRVELKKRGRTQVVHFERIEDRYVFRSVVLPPRHVTATDKEWRRLAYLTWCRNATKDLVAFAFDAANALIGVIEVPAATLDREELQMYVETLAKECDRFEYALTGEDTR